MLDRLFKDMPARIRALPVSAKGFPIPYFAEEVNGERDFRVVSTEKMAHALRVGLCWVCGGRLGKYKAFVIGPMCGINRTISEPPSHRDCAIFAARNCPFLASPMASRRAAGLPEDAQEAAGVMIQRNPGAVGVWITLDYRPFRAHAGNAGVLINIGEPTEVLWFAKGEPATRAEVVESVRTGLHHLIQAADDDSMEARIELSNRMVRFERYLPPLSVEGAAA